MSAAKPPRAKAVPASRFYKEALTPEQQEMLPAARRLKGLKEEIATLRVKLFSAINDDPKNFRLMKLGIDSLVNAVATEYRLSPKAKRELTDNLAATLNSIGDQLLPPGR